MAPLFLNLPGELRNRVYQLVLEHDAKVKKIRHRQEGSRDPWRRANDTRRRLPDEEVGFFHSYAGLTRVCREIREEYLPLHLSRRHVRLKVRAGYDDLDKIPAIFLDEYPHVNPIWRLDIIVRSSDKTLSSYVDLLPILRNTNLWIDTHFHGSREQFELHFGGFRLLKCIVNHHDNKWVEMIRTAAFAAVKFNMISREIRIVLSHGSVAHVDVSKADQVRSFLRSMNVLKAARLEIAIADYYPGVTVSVTREPGREHVLG